MHLCVVGWMDGKKAGYPIRFPSAKCGDNHVGIVLYKEPVNASWPYDAYCYRMKGMTARKSFLVEIFCEFLLYLNSFDVNLMAMFLLYRGVL